LQEEPPVERAIEPQVLNPLLPSAEDLEVYRIVFELFDRGQTGHI
jgi:hypothetical protein